MYPTRPERLHLIVAFAVLVVLLLLQQQSIVAIPGSGRVSTALPDALHGPWFAIVSWILAVFVRHWAGRGATVAITAMVGDRKSVV